MRRDELLDGEISYSLKGAQTHIEAWRQHHNARRPHSALGWRPPAPGVVINQTLWPPAMEIKDRLQGWGLAD